jgi:hypothetical protein
MSKISWYKSKPLFKVLGEKFYNFVCYWMRKKTTIRQKYRLNKSESFKTL